MAHTAGSNFPMAPAHPSGDGANKSMVIPIDTSMAAMRGGDVLCTIKSTGYVAVNNEADGEDGDEIIVGIAMLPSAEVTVTGTPDPERGTGPNVSNTYDVVNVSLALPGAVFTGNIVDGAGDQTAGVVAEDLRIQTEVTESDQGYACLDLTATAGNLVACTLEYTSPQYLVASSRWQYGRNAGVGIVNPRAKFVFLTEATIFGNIIG